MIYSELRSDVDILHDTGAARGVFVVGCPACANMSLYIQNSAEDSATFVLTPTGYKAVSMNEEVERLTQLFVNRGLDVGSWVGKYPLVGLCILDESARKDVRKRCQDFDTVITLCCEAGKTSIEGLLPGKKTVSGMNAKGIVNAKIKSKMKFIKYYIDKDSVNFTRFTFDSEPESSEPGVRSETTDEMLH